MNIAALPLGESGVSYYRVLIPLRKMSEVDPTIKPIVKFTKWANTIEPEEIEELEALAEMTDIVIIQRRFGPDWENLVRFYHSENIKVVYELDDAMEGMDPANLKPLYRDLLNPETLRSTLRMCEMADMVTVSTPEIKQWLLHRSNIDDGIQIKVLLNTIDFSMWPDPDQIERINNPYITVGYAAGEQHKTDLQQIGGALHTINQGYNTNGQQSVFFGFMAMINNDMWELKPNVAYKAGEPFLNYPMTLASLGYDIGLAPLKECMFNGCKSELRYLEYSALKIATIASPVAPYIRAIGMDGSRGILVSKNSSRRWKSAIKQLLDDPEKMMTMGENAYNYVKEHYNMDTYVYNWLKIYKGLV